MNLNGIMLGSADPQRLVAYYRRLFGEPGWSDEGYSGWQLGSGWLAVGAHDQVSGLSAQPGRVMWNIETADVKGEFGRLRAAGATVVREPYNPGAGDESGEGGDGGETGEFWIATFADPDNNYFQLVSPM